MSREPRLLPTVTRRHATEHGDVVVHRRALRQGGVRFGGEHVRVLAPRVPAARPPPMPPRRDGRFHRAMAHPAERPTATDQGRSCRRARSALVRQRRAAAPDPRYFIGRRQRATGRTSGAGARRVRDALGADRPPLPPLHAVPPGRVLRRAVSAADRDRGREERPQGGVPRRRRHVHAAVHHLWAIEGGQLLLPPRSHGVLAGMGVDQAVLVVGDHTAERDRSINRHLLLADVHEPGAQGERDAADGDADDGSAGPDRG